MPRAGFVPIEQRHLAFDDSPTARLETPGSEAGMVRREPARRPFGIDSGFWSEQHEPVALGSSSGSEAPMHGLAESDSTSSAPRARIEALLRRLDPALDERTLADVWHEAGSDETTRAQRLAGFLHRVLNVSPEEAPDASAQLASLERAAQRIQGPARFVRFEGMTGSELEQLAATDGAVREALAEHLPWAFTGNRALTNLGDLSGRYDRFDADTGELLITDAWLGDRARHAAWRAAASNGASLDVDENGWRFIDRAAGEVASVELAGLSGEVVHQVIFARDDGDRVTGTAATDRVHGGLGDDVVRGRGGDDLLEGGAGNDALLAGAGRDLVLGQQGDDELDGGAGGDRIEGGSGSDELFGGRGNDLLRGGAGVDSYLFEAGDGTDTIEDGDGVVVVDDIAIAGTMRSSGEGWVSADGRFDFRLEDDGLERPTLVIRSTADARDPAQTTVRIAAWTPGAFGISLADGDETDANEAAPTSLATPREAPLPSSEPCDTLPFLDMQTIARALDAWSPPAPPDIPLAAAGATAVTLADFGDAVSEIADGSEPDGGTAPLTLDAFAAWSSTPSDDFAARSPPGPPPPRIS